MAKAETRIVRKIILALGEAFPGAYFRKIHGNPFQHVGIPDIIGCVEGFFIALEVKTESGESSPIQKIELTTIQRAGGIQAVVISPEEAVKVVQDGIEKSLIQLQARD